jgi:hypothetical protein
MRIKALIVAFLTATLGAVAMQASVDSFTGVFPGDDFVSLFEITVGPDSSLVAQTFGYAGGTNGNGTVIPAGGFDPVLSLFDPTGALIQINDDGGCAKVGKDPVTGSCFDSFLSQTNLTTPGIYTLALTEAPNQAQDSLGQPDTFIYPAGTGNFTCAMYGPGSPTSPFCDINGDQRNGNWALDVSGSAVTSVKDVTATTPEPSSYVLLLLGCGAGLVLLRILRPSVRV